MIGKTMTAPRPSGKPRLPLSRRRALAAVAAVGAWAAVSRVGAATTEQVVADHHGGIAIGGFDPVAYFVDAAAESGKAEFEHTHAGVVWRFRNEGNRAAFAADPDVYMPRFGGYDPMGIVRGVAVPGDPRQWLIADERLYLFYSRAARDAFADDVAALAARADAQWPAVLQTLSP
jgi:hypothetical protein